LSDELKCLIDNVYYEARGETLKGQVLVARVTLNRTKHKNFPDTICGVVYQPYQFSWTQLKILPTPNPERWQVAAKAAYLGSFSNSKALYFHNMTVQPEWSYSKQFLLSEGNHVFYK
jgi:spore germination cell wall hydrolase CwlJ-like protein